MAWVVVAYKLGRGLGSCTSLNPVLKDEIIGHWPLSSEQLLYILNI